MTDPTVLEALRVVIQHLRDTPAVAIPSISMPLADWEAAQARIASLENQNATLLRQWSDVVKAKESKV